MSFEENCSETGQSVTALADHCYPDHSTPSVKEGDTGTIIGCGFNGERKFLVRWSDGTEGWYPKADAQIGPAKKPLRRTG